MAANMIPEDLKARLLKYKKEDMTVKLITELFANRAKPGNAFEVIPPVFNTQWKMNLKANEYINTTPVSTTVGIFLFNKLLVEGGISTVIPGGYYNVTITKKTFSIFLDYIAQGIMNAKISIKPTVYEFLRDYEFWGLKLVTIFSPSYTMELIKPDSALSKLREGMFNQDTSNATIAEMVQMETELLDQAKKSTDGNPGRTLFDSGSRGSFDNDFKNMFISVGPVQNPITGEYDFMKSNYLDGISKEDLVAAGNIIVNAEYPKAIGTAKGGYLTKQFNAVFQTILLGDPGTDCGTKGALTVTITKNNLDLYLDQYIQLANGKLVLVTPELDVSYMNHPVKLRSPMYCLHLDKEDAICNHCAGERFYKLGVRSMGLTSTNLSAQLMNASLKLRHNMKVDVNKIDPNKILK